jgi:uncharacterized Zn finger protein
MNPDVKAKCPECGTEITSEDLIKEWNATPKARAGEIQVTIHYWKCPWCGRKFRTATRIWLKEKGPLQKLKDALAPPF